MKRFIFTNLLIDQIWDQNSILDKVFQIPNPDSVRLSRLNENLGLYLADSENMKDSLHVFSLKPDHFWINSFAPLKSFKDLQYVVFNSQPRCIESWLSEFEMKLGLSKWDEYVFAGISNLEINLLAKTNGTNANLKFPFVKFNKKDFLKLFCESENIAFPQSEIITGENISTMSEDEQKNFIFKSLTSSGGSGLFDSNKLQTVQTWVERNNLIPEWKQSVWLKQEIIHRKEDFTAFGHTDSSRATIVKVHYDQKLLSDVHLFNLSLDKKIESSIQDCYAKVRQSLMNEGYEGPFGFDSILATNGIFFPMTDLNVRMTKTHLLAAALKFWNPVFNKNMIARMRFLNPHSRIFESFWSFATRSLNLDAAGIGTHVQIIPVDVSGWAYGRAEVTWCISSIDDAMAEEARKHLEKLINQFVKENGA